MVFGYILLSHFQDLNAHTPDESDIASLIQAIF
jgi:hypothetical protein